MNRIRSEVGRTKENMHKQVLIIDKDYECGDVQTRYLLECPILPVKGEIMDIIGHQLKDNAIKIADFRENNRI